MVKNYYSKNEFVSYIAKIAFKCNSSRSGRNLSKIMYEYNVDPIFMDNLRGMSHVMENVYLRKCADEIYGEEWKIGMILDLVDVKNGICESNLSEDENLILLTELCIL